MCGRSHPICHPSLRQGLLACWWAGLEECIVGFPKVQAVPVTVLWEQQWHQPQPSPVKQQSYQKMPKPAQRTENICLCSSPPAPIGASRQRE